MPNTKVLLLLAGLQVAILLGMFAKGLYPLAVGSPVLLKTMPVDPRDLFRGDYAVLGYDINTLWLDSLPNDLDSRKNHRFGDWLYVELVPNGRFHEPVGVWESHPGPGRTCIKGTVRYNYGRTLDMQYGIESYFTSPDKAKQLEDLVRARGEGAATVYVKIMLTDTGLSRIASIHCDEAGF